MKVVLSGGGTGGHIYPALTIAGALRRLDPDCEITFVGTQKGLEKDIIPRYGYPLKFIQVAGFERHLGLAPESACELVLGMKETLQPTEPTDPDLVIGTGGYVCGPILFWAAMKRVPTCIQEQNAMPGVTNKILSRFVDEVFLGYKEGGRYFASHAKKGYTGNPVRQEILKPGGRRPGKIRPDPEKTTLLAFGAAGSPTINQAMVTVEQKLAGNPRIQILHATGTAGYENMQKPLGTRCSMQGISMWCHIYDMPLALAAADLAVSRAGAIGLAELMVKGIPSILVPYPYATANHQEYNARALAAQGAALVALDKDLTGDWLLEEVEKLLREPERLETMHRSALRAAMPQAADAIAEAAMELAERNK